MADTGAIQSSASTTNPGNRKRRNPYTPIACDECKRRKIKCTGERPCKGCRNTDTPCLFERTTRYRANTRAPGSNNGDFDIATIPEPTAAVTNAIEVIPRQNPRRGSNGSLPAEAWRGLDSEGSPATTTTHTNASETPRNIVSGLQISCDNSFVAADLMRQLVALHHAGSLGSIFAHLLPDRWPSILSAYDEEIGMLYPYLDLDAVKREILELNSDLASTADGDRLEHILILILAVVSSLEDQDMIKVVQPWVEDIYKKYFFNTQMNPATAKDVAYLLLCCSYFFLGDRDLMAWRAVGAVMRLLLEMGYHKGEVAPTFDRPSRRNGYVIEDRLFWCVYAFDRRLSFEARMPFIIQDRDISRDLKFPDKSIEVQFLKQMVVLGRISGDVRDFFASKANFHTANTESERDFLDYRTVQWRENITKTLRFGGIDDKFDPAREKRARYRLRVVLYLKASQLRMLILRRWAAKPGGNAFDDTGTNKVADIARESIRIILNLATATDIRRYQHRMFNHFIQVALSSLLLALNANKQIDATAFIEDAHDAMELLKRLSFHSPITLKLMEKLGWVRDVVDKIRAGKNNPNPASDGMPHLANPEQSSPRTSIIAGIDSINVTNAVQDRHIQHIELANRTTNEMTDPWATATSEFPRQHEYTGQASNIPQLYNREHETEDSLSAMTGALNNASLVVTNPSLVDASANELAYQHHTSPMATLSSQPTQYHSTADDIDLQAYLSVLRYPELGELLNEYAFQDNFSF